MNVNLREIIDFYNNNQLDKAKELCEQAIINDQNPKLLNILGVICYKQKNNSEAIKYFEKAYEINDKLPDPYNNIGIIYNDLGEHNKAILFFKRAIQKNDQFYQAYFNLGNSFKALNKLNEAKDSYKKSIEINTNYIEALNNLGIIYNEKKEYNKAIELYRKIIKINFNYTPAYNNLGNSLYQDGQTQKAIEIFEKGINIDPKNYKALTDLSNAYKSQGKVDKSIDLLKQSIRINPDYAESYSYLGNIYADMGELNTALKYFKLGLSKDNKLKSINYNIAMILYKTNKLKEAVKFFEKSKHDDFEERILQCHYKLGEFDLFNANLKKKINEENNSRIIASLTAHASINLNQENDYNFCKDPLNFIYKKKLKNQKIINDLSDLTKELNIANRDQALLSNGIQSSGNLFDLDNSIIKQLKELIIEHAEEYYASYKDENNFIKKRPSLKKMRGWFIVMQSGGYLKPHIHESGWLSGSIYLKMPKSRENEGNIEFGLDGNEYPKNTNNFPKKVVDLESGDIVLFPSSLFHRTLPFSGKERICIAFDINP